VKPDSSTLRRQTEHRLIVSMIDKHRIFVLKIIRQNPWQLAIAKPFGNEFDRPVIFPAGKEAGPYLW